MAASETNYYSEGLPPVQSTIEEMQRTLESMQKGEFHGRLVKVPDERDKTIATIKEIGKHLLSNQLLKEDVETLNKLLVDCTEILSKISHSSSDSMSFEMGEAEYKHMLLCALQIREVSLQVLYRGSPVLAHGVDADTLRFRTIASMAEIRETKLEQIKVIWGDKRYGEIRSLYHNRAQTLIWSRAKAPAVGRS